VEVTDRRTQIDYANQMKYLVDEHFPQAQKIIVVQDNLNTHVKFSLYKAFIPSEARRILGKLEFHYTPKHGSWLNMAEIELSVLSRQCLDRRISSKEVLLPFSQGVRYNFRISRLPAVNVLMTSSTLVKNCPEWKKVLNDTINLVQPGYKFY